MFDTHYDLLSIRYCAHLKANKVNKNRGEKK